MIRLTPSRFRRAVGVASLTASLVLTASAAAFAEPPVPDDGPYDARWEENPQSFDGNPGCSWFYGTDDEAPFTQLTKITPGSDLEPGDSITADGVTVDVVSVKDNGEVITFDWDSGEINISLVIVKASDGANVWSYAPDGATSDTGLWTVGNAEDGWHGVSHITFCQGAFDTPDEEEEDPTFEPEAEIEAECETGIEIKLDNSGTDGGESTEYTVTVTLNGSNVLDGETYDVAGGAQQTINAVAELADGDEWSALITAADMTDVSDAGTADCPSEEEEEEEDVDDEVIERSPNPGAAFSSTCEPAPLATVGLSNTGDADAEFTIVGNSSEGNDVSKTVTVGAGQSVLEEISMVAGESVVFQVTSGSTVWDYTADADPCVKPAATDDDGTEVLGEKLTNDPAPAPEVQGEQLAATGLESTDLLLLAMLFGGLGLAVLLATSKNDPLFAHVQH